MLAVIDETGDPGFSVGSSPWFVMAMVVFPSFSAAEQTSQMINEARRIAGVRGEFKFTSTSDKTKKVFFETIRECNFRINCVVVEKKAVRRREVRESPSTFYLLCLRGLMGDTGEIPKGITVKLDKCGNKQFRNACASYARKDLPRGTIKQFKLVDSESDNLVQLADMVAGAIARPYNRPNQSNCHIWYDCISHFIMSDGENVIR